MQKGRSTLVACVALSFASAALLQCQTEETDPGGDAALTAATPTSTGVMQSTTPSASQTASAAQTASATAAPTAEATLSASAPPSMTMPLPSSLPSPSATDAMPPATSAPADTSSPTAPSQVTTTPSAEPTANPTSNGGAGGAGGNGSAGDGTTPVGGAGPMPPAEGVCPADATFCADFESAEMPEGAQYFRNAAPAEWTADFEVDASIAFEGAASLRVKTTMEASESAYKMLAVPTPGSTFWVRAYLRSDAVLGQGTLSASEHNRFMIAASQPEPNSTDALEFAEDCGIALNSHDQVYRPEGGNATCDAPLRLEPDTWYCVEVSFNGATGDTQVYVDDELQIDAAAWEPGKGNYTHLKFGVDNLHPIVRNVWYDAIAVGPTRPGCL